MQDILYTPYDKPLSLHSNGHENYIPVRVKKSAPTGLKFVHSDSQPNTRGPISMHLANKEVPFSRMNVGRRNYFL